MDFVGDRRGVLGPAIGVLDDDADDDDDDDAAAAAVGVAAEDADEDEEDGRSGDAELVRVGVGGAGLVSRNARREPSKGDLEGSGRFGMTGDGA